MNSQGKQPRRPTSAFYLSAKLGNMTVDEWHRRLATTFMVNGLIGGHLVEVQEREDQVGGHLVRTFKGQNALIDSFQSFYVETLNLVAEHVAREGRPPNSESYPLAVAHFHGLFRRYRACENLFYRGYPLDGYSLLRDVKDRVILLAGVAHNMTTFARIMGTVPEAKDKAELRKVVTRNRRAEEQRVFKRMYGDESELPSEVVAELRTWNELFHDEVHGGKLSLFHEIGFLRSGLVNRVGPTAHQEAFTMYMNRAAELGWLTLRLMPYLQTTANSFGETWGLKYTVLDDSFRFMVQGLSTLGKKIGDAFIVLVDRKISFGQPFYYFEADGSAGAAANHTASA